ncbi:hypothetical protein [Rugamonas sp.]|uniref:hypothetical protein n=1 Tax=Rugamonas sp. TaxID=1926287 RepID=UPI0025DF2FB6|nr:hypothetical protein [Rugamonas sp.]
MKKTINKAPALSIAIPVFTPMESGPLACRDADEEAIIRAYRGLPRGEIQRTVVRLMAKYLETFGDRMRPRLSLVAGSKGIRNE